MSIGKTSKEYLGLALEADRLYVARIRKAKGIMELLDVETLELPELLEKSGEEEQGQEASGADDDSIFGLDDDAGEPGALDLDEDPDEAETFNLDEDPDEAESFDLSEDPGEQDSEDFDMTETGESAGDTNEQVLAGYIGRLAGNKPNIGINIPAGKSILLPLEGVYPKKMKKKELEELLLDKLDPIYQEGVSAEQYNYEINPDGQGWLLSFDNDRSLLNLIDDAANISGSKPAIHEMLSDEVLWTGLARMHADLGENEITAIVSIGKESSRVLFLRGDRIFHVLPVINEPASSGHILETIFSKLLFEMDRGTLPELHRMLIMQCTIQGEKAEKYFKEQLDDVYVALFQPDPEKLELPEHLAGKPAALQPYWSAIGAAWAASGADNEYFPALSLLPEYIRERQRVFKLEWHGMILLVLIALTPLAINQWYQEKSDELGDLTRAVNLIDTQIADTRPIAGEVERLTAEQAVIRENNERVTELAQDNRLWSETLDRLNRGVQQMPGTWLTTLQVSGDNLSVDGYSLYRQQIPRLSGLFYEGHVMQVTEGEMRERTIYRFSVQINNFGDHVELISPELPEMDEELIREIPMDFEAR